MLEDRFKFRLYDKAIGEMVYDVCVSTDDWVCADTSCGQITYRGDKLKDIVLMRCTGLRDYNNNLIYEGDIIKIPSDYDTYGMFAGEKREVYFYKGGFRLKPKWDKNSRGNWLEDTNAFEVVGNIYENLELLEGEE